MKNRSCIAWFVGAFACAWFSLGAGAAAQTTISPEKNAFNKVKFADRQLILTEQMAKAVCFVMGDVEASAQSDNARGSAELFQTTLNALRTGDENMAILPEEDEGILSALDDVEALFRSFGAATLQLSANDLHSIPVSQVINLSEPILSRVGIAIERYRETYRTGEVDPVTQHTLDVARRQVMLTQRAAKELCFVALGVDADRMRKGLTQTVEAFETALAALETGNDDMQILPPPAAKFTKKLADIRALWAEIAPVFRSAIGQEAISRDDMVLVMNVTNKLLFKSNQAVRFYAKL